MKYIAYNIKNFRKIEYLKYLDPTFIEDTEIVAKVLPFKTNNYIVDYLIDWGNYETDPIYTLTFPNNKMLLPEHFDRVKSAMRRNISQDELTRIINNVRLELNPHPAEQASNVPKLNGELLTGVQHKYRDIVLFSQARVKVVMLIVPSVFVGRSLLKTLIFNFRCARLTP